MLGGILFIVLAVVWYFMLRFDGFYYSRKDEDKERNFRALLYYGLAAATYILGLLVGSGTFHKIL